VRRPLALVVLLTTFAAAACGSANGPSTSASTASQRSASSTTSLSPTTPASPTERPTASPRPAIGQPADDGAVVVRVTDVDDRTKDLLIDSPAIGSLVGVRLYLPKAFDAQPTTDWPVFYLLHGAGGSHADWAQYTDAEDLLKSTDVLAVLPDGGDLGFYSDWWNDDKGGPPMWETFHLVELRQLLERNWHAADKRVVAGLSMGGYGAMEYAARQPGLFLAAASFSGALDPIGAQLDIGTEDIWGDPVAQADIWEAHDPTTNAAALKGTALYVAYGDGGKGPLDATEPPSDDLEPWIADQNRAFIAALAANEIPATIDAYGPGSHDWPYWERALHDSLPFLLKALE
jgi:diacylglycerol O-acyltransferase/trehalose O-mycolyltransferase